MPTYLAIPVITAALFFTAAFSAWLELLRATPLPAVILAVIWVALLSGALLRMELAFVMSIITLIFAGLAARLLAGATGWQAPLARVAAVEIVMALTALAALLLERRSRRAR